MELSLESDAEALWQDALDLLSQRNLPESVLAMLRNCRPVRMEDSTLYVETSMRLVQKTVTKNVTVVEECLARAAFEPVALVVTFVQAGAMPIDTGSVISRESAERICSTAPAPLSARTIQEDNWDEERAMAASVEEGTRRRNNNPLVEDISENDSKLTFGRFVRGDENEFAYEAALRVAEGENKSYNPLFIYGKSGLGKTHLLRAIQNYIARNDPGRICVYKDTSSFIGDYTSAMQHRERRGADILTQNYCDIDVLIIDDIQNMAGKAGTIGFFFDTFNTLISNGKQIVLAADRSPAQLGIGKDAFDERVTSRIGAGFPISIQVPSYELKYRLISTFCTRLREDAAREHVGTAGGEIGEADLRFMAERAGTNIRVIEGFCSKCLFIAAQRQREGVPLTHEDILRVAKEAWPNGRRQVTVDEIQKVVEKYYDISHDDLIGGKRNKELMEPRHVAIWLTRELTDTTLADIGKRFGGRSHATIKHSIGVVDDAKREDKGFYDRVSRIQDSIVENE